MDNNFLIPSLEGTLTLIISKVSIALTKVYII